MNDVEAATQRGRGVHDAGCAETLRKQRERRSTDTAVEGRPVGSGAGATQRTGAVLVCAYGPDPKDQKTAGRPFYIKRYPRGARDQDRRARDQDRQTRDPP